MSVICDLDGVVYRGDQALPGSAAALSRLLAAEVPVLFATNNSTRPASDIEAKIRRVTGVDVAPGSVVTSSQAAAHLLGEDRGPVLILGGPGIEDALNQAGIAITPDPGEATAVVVGLDRDLDYDRLSRAVTAVRSGARFIATNTDATFPIHGGVLPGGGAMVAAVAIAAGTQPEVAGKPHAAMRDLLRARNVDGAWVIGDRIESDVAMAAEEADWRSILVLTGVTEPGAAARADHVVPDLAAAVDLVLGQAEGR